MNLLKLLILGPHIVQLAMHSICYSCEISIFAFIKLLDEKSLVDPSVPLLEIPGNLELGLEVDELIVCCVTGQQ
ncbi:hypothetical protein BJK06_15055 [Curtobacterium sp. BH-2-1-1]|nr:hypothetical protein BJK06_15055 [Curtobacterium sp. BH-2-1-1]